MKLILKRENNFRHNIIKTLILILLAASLSGQTKSDYIHTYGSAVATVAVGVGVNKITKKPGRSVVIAVLSIFALGYAKERVYDGYMKRGVNSNADLVYDLRGIALGAFLLGVKFNIDYTDKKEKPKYENSRFEF